MSTAVGFRFLYDAGYIHREMEDWFNVGVRISEFYLCWVTCDSVEILTTWLKLRCFCPRFSGITLPPMRMKICRASIFLLLQAHLPTNWISTFDGIVPSHFYGELAKTELGCQVLQGKGHFAEFAEFIRQHKDESEDVDIIMKLKSILWAVVIKQILCL